MSSVIIAGDTSGSVTLSAPAVSGTNTITLPAATGTSVLTNVTGNVDINAAGSNYVTLSTNTTERMRIDSSGNVLVGTTSASGTSTNTAKIVGGVYTTASGTTSAANNTAVTIFTCPALENGVYIVNAQLANNAPATYMAVSLISVGNLTLRATALATATNMTITVSSQNIQATQTSGSPQTITWTITRFA